MTASLRELLADLPARTREQQVRRLPPDLRTAIADVAWETTARLEQLPPPGDWVHLWLVGGRGSGKTRPAAEAIHRRAIGGKLREAVLIGPTAADLRDVMVVGPSGILNTGLPSFRPTYEPSKRLITWPNGAVAHTRSAEDPDSIRGLNVDSAWVDEPATFRYGIAVRDNLALALRVGEPRAIWSTTPRRVPLVREELAEADRQHAAVATVGGFELTDVIAGRFVTTWRTEPTIVVARMSTYDNLANLAPAFAREILARYEGTRLGRQELYGELLEDVGTMFQRAWFADRFVDTTPDQFAGAKTMRARAWDFASTPVSDVSPDPDWTVGTRLGRVPSGDEIVEDVRRVRATPGEVEQLVVLTAKEDGPNVTVVIEEEGGSAGKAQVAHYKRLLAGIARVTSVRPTGPKEARAAAVSSLAEQARLSVVRGAWNAAWLDELEEFPNGPHDDQVDTLSLGHNWLAQHGQRSLVTTTEARMPVRSGGSLPRTQIGGPRLPGPATMGRWR